jgi:hypothetical protein
LIYAIVTGIETWQSLDYPEDKPSADQIPHPFSKDGDYGTKESKINLTA